MKAVLASSGKELAGNVNVAESFMARLLGLLGRDHLPVGEGLLTRPCKGIHTFFMKFPIDAVYLDRNNRIVAAYRTLNPYRMTRVLMKTASVLALPAGTLDTDVAIGDGIEFI
jgi:uncharacterized membrane protein (UPF0127 family)